MVLFSIPVMMPAEHAGQRRLSEPRENLRETINTEVVHFAQLHQQLIDAQAARRRRPRRNTSASAQHQPGPEAMIGGGDLIELKSSYGTSAARSRSSVASLPSCLASPCDTRRSALIRATPSLQIHTDTR